MVCNKIETKLYTRKLKILGLKKGNLLLMAYAGINEVRVNYCALITVARITYVNKGFVGHTNRITKITCMSPFLF